MSTPSKEALDAACDLFKHRYCYGSDNDNAAIIDRHFEPLRQRSEQAEARVKELEFGLKHQCETCEMKSIFDGEHAYALKMQARVKELEAENENAAEAYKLLQSDTNALRAANAELKKQEAESRRLFYAEQDKRQSAEQRNAELEAALRKCRAFLNTWRDCLAGVQMKEQDFDSLSGVKEACEALARAESGTPDHIRDAAQMVSPAKHPDTELIDEFAALCGSLEYCDADDVPSHWRASGYAGSHERAGSSLRDALRTVIDAARKQGGAA